MSAKYDGGPAFPTEHSRDTSYSDIKGGMSLRDYFAAKALAGIVGGDHPITHEEDAPEKIARAAYEVADAMLEARDAD